MADELTSKITLTGTAANFGQALSVSQSTTFTCSHTSGLAQANITSTSKVCKIFCTDGDGDVADVTSREGQYVDITDNHGFKRRYVFTTADAGGAATGAILASGTNTGSGDITTRLHLVGGIAVQITNGDEERDILEQLRSAINHANGHGGSIVATAVASEANGPQSTTLTNRDSLTPPFVDKDNATWQDLHSSTNSLQDHITVVKKGEFAAPAILYLRNEQAHGNGNADIVYLYWDDTLATNFMEIKGGQFAYIPINPHANLMAYASDAAVLEFSIFGNNA